jgi:hypothetical protein
VGEFLTILPSEKSAWYLLLITESLFYLSAPRECFKSIRGRGGHFSFAKTCKHINMKKEDCEESIVGAGRVRERERFQAHKELRVASVPEVSPTKGSTGALGMKVDPTLSL